MSNEKNWRIILEAKESKISNEKEVRRKNLARLDRMKKELEALPQRILNLDQEILNGSSRLDKLKKEHREILKEMEKHGHKLPEGKSNRREQEISRYPFED